MSNQLVETKNKNGLQNLSPTGAQVSSVATNSSRNYNLTDDIKPTKKRYLVLLLFCLHSTINGAQWIYLCSVSNIITKYYQVDNIAVNWTSMVYMLVYIPLIVPSSWLFERIGMRNSILLGSLGTTLGSAIKCFSCQPDGFYLLMFGQTIVAICQLFVLSVPPRLAAVWFPDHQVSLATACGVFGNQLGIALGFVVPQLVLSGHQDSGLEMVVSTALIGRSLYHLFMAIALCSAITSLLILLLFDHSPEKAPGLARLQQIKQENAAALAETGVVPLVIVDAVNGSNKSATTTTTATTTVAISGGGANFGALLWSLLSDRNFFMLVISYGLNVGVFYAISTVLNQMIATTWQDPAGTLSGRLGLVMVVSGMFGSVISGYILDKTHRYRLVNMTLYGLSLTFMVLFAVTLELHNTIAIYLVVALLGYFMTGYLLIGFEVSNEITWPKPESVSAGLLNLSAQVFGVLLTYIGTSIVDNHGNKVANTFLTSALFLGFIVTVLIKTQTKRQNAIEG